MSERRRLGVQDALWLEMDRPNNLMVVDSVIWTSEPLEWDAVHEVLQERLCERYPVFRSRAVRNEDQTWAWEVDEHFRLQDRVTAVELDDPDSPGALQELIARHRTEMLDRDQPLWEVLWVERYGPGSALVLRTHHAVADGMRMVQLAMSLFDASPEGGAVLGPTVTQHAAHPAPPGQPIGDRIRNGVANMGKGALDTARWALGMGRDLVAAAPEIAAEATRFARTAPVNPVGAGHGLVIHARDGAALAVDSLLSSLRAGVPGGGPLIDLFSATPGDVESIRKLLLGTRNDTTIWSGTAGVEKAVAWSDPLSLEDVKKVAKANRATVNDVLVTCVAGALNRYLTIRGEHCGSVAFMVPVNLTPIDLSLPEDLGNGFALVQLELPTDDPDLLAVLRVAKRRMDRIKHGHEAAIAFRLQETIAGLNPTVYETSVDLLANRTVGSLTNVPGPPVPVYLAGRRVEGMVGWAPVSGDQPMSFTIYSYDGRVTVGIACDTALVPDHDIIVRECTAVFDQLLGRSDP